MGNSIDKVQAYRLMEKTKGKFFSVVFTKRSTGEERYMTCRLGVKKGVKGVGLGYDTVEKKLLGVFDMQKDNFRMISLDTISYLKCEGVEYEVI